MNSDNDRKDKERIEALTARYGLGSEQRQCVMALLVLVSPRFAVDEVTGTEPAIRYQPVTNAIGS